jgi:poly(3-hydroxybutyrate) depolymerase
MTSAARATVASAAVLVVTLVACQQGTTSSGESKNALSNAGESWCPDGFESGPNETCFAIPEHAAKDTPVLVYLHGSYQGHGSPEEWSAVRLAAQRGFAVIIPRGKRGLCAWRTEVKDHYCWPQEPEDTAGIKKLISEWEPVVWQVDALLEQGTHKRYVLGSGNGGFFASFVATHALFPAQAYAVVNGGSLAAPGKGKPVPLLLISAPDPESGPKMKELHEVLGKASWTHAFCPRQGGAALTNDDVEAAVSFFRHDVDGSLKPQGASYPCEPSGPRR